MYEKQVRKGKEKLVLLAVKTPVHDLDCFVQIVQLGLEVEVLQPLVLAK